MKGIVFTEFLEMVEAGHGLDLVDELTELPGLKSGGIYTAVGTYDAGELLAMVSHLSERLGVPVEALVIGFGEHLFARFPVLFPDLFAGCDDALDFLQSVEGHIHVEVRKLYPEAELPSFEYNREGAGLRIVYASSRPLAAFAEGLVRGCLAHFGSEAEVVRTDLGACDGTAAELRVA